MRLEAWIKILVLRELLKPMLCLFVYWFVLWSEHIACVYDLTRIGDWCLWNIYCLPKSNNCDVCWCLQTEVFCTWTVCLFVHTLLISSSQIAGQLGFMLWKLYEVNKLCSNQTRNFIITNQRTLTTRIILTSLWECPVGFAHFPPSLNSKTLRKLAQHPIIQQPDNSYAGRTLNSGYTRSQSNFNHHQFSSTVAKYTNI